MNPKPEPNKPRLSFCIPTYNFGQFLPQTLDSIISQDNGHIEIVIVDGNSTDNTDQIIHEYQQRFPRLTFFKRDKRCGVDRDILKSVELAQSDYCWLFSADDVLSPGAIDLIFQNLTGQWNIAILNFMLCDYNLNPITSHDILNSADKHKTYNWSDPAELNDYLSRSLTSTALFSFISSIIVNRNDWLAADPCTEFHDSCWIIQAKAYAIAKNNLTLWYYPDPVFLKRGENDSFLYLGIAGRVELALDKFPAIAQHFWGKNSPIHRAAKRVTRNEISFSSLLVFKEKASQHNESLTKLYNVIRRSWIRYKRDHLSFLIIRLFPISLIYQLRDLCKKNASLFRMVKSIQTKLDL
ncbi:Abequosyltransferase RfbV [Poriferisphaera corsica]|uniref:Abequosyltransferase RfbV n=1 Tax=Poriferisphaera corsica TaxID=2528020 RepID=A0A517YPA8_9BACT|nr:glycosyltransferase family 2 protein [Poriferisphaera corsica]QDU32053.1 Abequosyltransferase RfbV [Poriferisphaera corsica]